MRIYLWLIIIAMCFFSSCGGNRKTSCTIVDYKRLLFSNGEYTTVLSRYYIQDTITTDTVESGYSVLSGNIFAREVLYELQGVEKSEKFSLFDNCFEWPRLIIPSLDLDLPIIGSTFQVSIPSGKHDIIVIAENYQPIYFRWNFISQHTYFINFYLGCTVIH